MSVAAVLLAAGASRRMGQLKQLMALDGETLVHRAARIALQAGCDPALVVLGNQAEEVAVALKGLPCSPVVNPLWEEGMASSIRAGLAAVPKSALAALLLVCDQPAVDADFIRHMVKAQSLQPKRIVAAAYAGTVGIPALFPRHCFEALMKLTGDRGARSLLEDADVLTLPLLGGGMDVDTILDFEEMKRRLEQS